ncbi:MAG: hypothetical protein ACRELB_12230 [Polyangiaceae bacterium]
MKRSILAAITCGVWVSAAASAAALTYGLNRPLRAPASFVAPEPSPPLTSSESTTLPDEVPSLLEVPVTTIVARVVHSGARAAALAPSPPRDIAAMSCAGWRDLDMGSGRVEICQ